MKSSFRSSNNVKLKPTTSKVISPVKWQRERKRLKDLRLFNDRAALPILNREAITSYRLPFHEAILRKMDKDGFKNSAEYLRQLLDYQEAFKKAIGEDSSMWQRPSLKNEQDVLQNLTECLKEAEKAHSMLQIDKEIDVMLKLTTQYCFGDENWWWIGHQLLFVLLNCVQGYEKDRGKRRALVRYVFGKFLFEHGKDPDLALEHLKIARRLASGMSWNINSVFEGKTNTVFSEACILIHKIRITEAKAIMKKDPKTAMAICEKARKRAKEGCFEEGVAASLSMKGNCQIMLFDTENAIKTYIKGLKTVEIYPNTDLKCELLRNLSIAYLKHGSLRLALITLYELKEYAQQNNKLLYLAQAHKYLGTYYLKEGTARNATPMLMTAVKIFNQIGETSEVAKTRNLAAISVGIEMMPIFSQIIRASDPNFSKEYTDKTLSSLIRWKDDRTSFWENHQTLDVTKVSVNTMESLSRYSQDDFDNIPVDEDMMVEQVLDITGLEETNEEFDLTNVTETVSNPGVEFSGSIGLLPGSVSPMTTSSASFFSRNYVHTKEREENSFI